MSAIGDAIATCAGLGWSLMLLNPGEKKTTERGWPDADDDPRGLLAQVLLARAVNLAVRLGERSGNLADVDLDTDESRAIAPFLLPPTPAMFGRDGVVGATHYFYVAPDGPPPGGRGTMRLNSAHGKPTDQSVTTYAELRWNGGYTVLPPSTHPDGGGYAWLGATGKPGSPPPVMWATLSDAVREVAAGALLLELYPRWRQLRGRHYVSLALSTSLLRAGWPPARVERFVYALARAGGDEEADARVDNARSSAAGHARGEHYGGWSALASWVDAERLARFQRFLGVDARATSAGDWAAVVSAGGGSPSNPPPAPTTPVQSAQRAPASPQAPPQVSGPVAPVIATAAQAAQAAVQQSKQATLSTNEVALAVAVSLNTKVPIARDEGQQLYHYAGGVYHSKGTELYLRGRIAAEVLTFGAEYLDKGIEDEVLHRLKVGADDLEERPDPWLLNLDNGLLDLRTLELRPHDPAVRTTLKLPITYDPSATCPKVESFCAQVFPQDAFAAGVPWEVVALCACPIIGIDKAILLLGEGENGKGIFLDLVLAFVGKLNASAVSLQRIGDDRFATADLRGKLLNVCADLPTRRLEDSGDFKIIVSGETIRAQRKNQPAFDFRPYCRLLFSSNNLPESDDASPGYVRRWHIIPFTQTFGPDNPLRRPRDEIVRELTALTELSGLLNLAIPFMVGFLNTAVPTMTDSMKDALLEFRELTDDFGIWLGQQLLPSPTGFVESGEISARWKARQDRRRLPGLVTGNRIAKAMRDRFPRAVKVQQRVNGTGQGQGQASGQPTQQGAQRRGYSGVSWRNAW